MIVVAAPLEITLGSDIVSPLGKFIAFTPSFTSSFYGTPPYIVSHSAIIEGSNVDVSPLLSINAVGQLVLAGATTLGVYRITFTKTDSLGRVGIANVRVKFVGGNTRIATLISFKQEMIGLCNVNVFTPVIYNTTSSNPILYTWTIDGDLTNPRQLILNTKCEKQNCALRVFSIKMECANYWRIPFCLRKLAKHFFFRVFLTLHSTLVIHPEDFVPSVNYQINLFISSPIGNTTDTFSLTVPNVFSQRSYARLVPNGKTISRLVGDVPANNLQGNFIGTLYSLSLIGASGTSFSYQGRNIGEFLPLPAGSYSGQLAIHTFATGICSALIIPELYNLNNPTMTYTAFINAYNGLETGVTNTPDSLNQLTNVLNSGLNLNALGTVDLTTGNSTYK